MISTLTFSADGAWLFAGTESGDVVTINVTRRAVQLMHTVASGGIGYTGLLPGVIGSKLLVGAADGTLTAFDFQQAVHSAPPLAVVPGGIGAAAAAAGGAGRRLLVGTRQGGLYRWVWLALGVGVARASVLQSP
jgi:hypothetical protein